MAFHTPKIKQSATKLIRKKDLGIDATSWLKREGPVEKWQKGRHASFVGWYLSLGVGGKSIALQLARKALKRKTGKKHIDF